MCITLLINPQPIFIIIKICLKVHIFNNSILCQSKSSWKITNPNALSVVNLTHLYLLTSYRSKLTIIYSIQISWILLLCYKNYKSNTILLKSDKIYMSTWWNQLTEVNMAILESQTVSLLGLFTLYILYIPLSCHAKSHTATQTTFWCWQ